MTEPASTLFGHRKGCLHQCHPPTAPACFAPPTRACSSLDEIGELGRRAGHAAPKAIEEKRFLPIGSDNEVGSDFQLIAGTHRDLRLDVAQGRFREDLLPGSTLWSYALPGWPSAQKTWSPTSTTC